MSGTVSILKFDPLTLELPADAMIDGELTIVLPPVHLVVYDLSMGGIIPGAPHVGADYPLARLTVPLDKPMGLGAVVDMVVVNLPLARAAWRSIQDKMKGKPIL